MSRRKNFFQTPKGIVTLVLAMFLVIAAPGQGMRTVATGLGSAVLAAGLVDMVILRVRKRVWEYPSGAVLTVLIVAMVLRAQEPWYVIAITSVIAVLSKYVFRTRTANIFNPAALALIISFYLFHTGQSWWGALVDTPAVTRILLIAAGGYVANRVNKLPLVLVFLGAYFLLFTATAFVSNPLPVAEIFRTPDFEAVLYFALIILTDPPTSPAKYPDQIICGLIVAVVSYACFELFGVVYYLLAGVIAGNLWEAWRRARRQRPRGPVPAKRGSPVLPSSF
ncbi:MAG TPA: RnfABCDGE type electron transport complex subunit D [Candidatus Sulfopaludibacter sp.]|nr:RnfABCDGE type electron transport complex subunit D [Candidatus Sulfopaludibacter sp.]